LPNLLKDLSGLIQAVPGLLHSLTGIIKAAPGLVQGFPNLIAALPLLVSALPGLLEELPVLARTFPEILDEFKQLVQALLDPSFLLSVTTLGTSLPGLITVLPGVIAALGLINLPFSRNDVFTEALNVSNFSLLFIRLNKTLKALQNSNGRFKILE
jgi:hypothetical protein